MPGGPLSPGRRSRSFLTLAAPASNTLQHEGGGDTPRHLTPPDDLPCLGTAWGRRRTRQVLLPPLSTSLGGYSCYWSIGSRGCATHLAIALRLPMLRLASLRTPREGWSLPGTPRCLRSLGHCVGGTPGQARSLDPPFKLVWSLKLSWLHARLSPVMLDSTVRLVLYSQCRSVFAPVFFDSHQPAPEELGTSTRCCFTRRLVPAHLTAD